jgi:CheY-like chemotaxis protein
MTVNEMKQKKILVVDDMSVSREMIGKILKKAHYSLDFAENGEQALQFLYSSNKYDLVLLDIEMPGINGFEVCQEMKKNYKLRDLPVIFLTSYSKIENKVFGFDSGAQDYVTKPFSSRELLARINTHIQLKQKTDIIREMNDTLLEKNKDITDSISYALHIQKALSSSTEILDKFNPKYFILNKPKDIISGDFLWFKQFSNLLYFAVADCTGHGVPGAFMSVLGISMLNEIVRDHYFYPPKLILNELRSKTIKSLNQGPESMKNADGMDIAICLINFETLTLQYSGANIPFFLLRKNPLKGNYEFIKRSADRMPVGRHPNEDKSFTNHVIELMEGDRIILFSDGYVSQFGGESNKTFKISRLRNELMEIQTHPIWEHAHILEEIIDDWRGENEQVDDILIFGIEVNKKESITWRDELK